MSGLNRATHPSVQSWYSRMAAGSASPGRHPARSVEGSARCFRARLAVSSGNWPWRRMAPPSFVSWGGQTRAASFSRIVFVFPRPDEPRFEAPAGVGGVRIGQPEPEIVGRGPVAADEVRPFRGPLVPEALFGAVGAPAELDPVGLDHVPPDPELEAALGLVDEDPGVPQLAVLEAQLPVGDDPGQGELRPVQGGIVEGDRGPPRAGLFGRRGGAGLGGQLSSAPRRMTPG